jgi:hypothetical protein
MSRADDARYVVVVSSGGLRRIDAGGPWTFEQANERADAIVGNDTLRRVARAEVALQEHHWRTCGTDPRYRRDELQSLMADLRYCEVQAEVYELGRLVRRVRAA